MIINCKMNWAGVLCVVFVILKVGEFSPTGPPNDDVDPYDRFLVDGSAFIDAEKGGEDHHCFRTCEPNKPKICEYNITVSSAWTMSSACGKCPYVAEDCLKPGCIPGNGYKRPITVANEMLPGPAVLVCLGDTIIFNVANGFESDSTSIHFHGAHQRGTPWMDGTPFITQCPILPITSFQYNFTAEPAGTHMWHGHTGLHEADGLYGMYVVRKPEVEPIYDFDLPEHTMIVWSWLDKPTKNYISNVDRDEMVFDLTINGKSSLRKFETEEKIYNTPGAVFEVQKGGKYRFRTAFNSLCSCPVQFSIDEHKMTIIGSDSGESKPLEVDSFMAHAGERYDFVLHADQEVDAYWIRLRSNNCCGHKIGQDAVLKYFGSKNDKPSKEPAAEFRVGKLLNPIERSTQEFPGQELIAISDLESAEPTRNISGIPDLTLYLVLDFSEGGAPQINGITFAYPHSPFVSQWEFTNNTCTGETAEKHCINGRCVCSYVQKVPKDSLLEIVVVDTSPFKPQEHPMHLHGDHFQTVAMEVIGKDITLEQVQKMNEDGEIEKNFENVMYKDTLSIPNKGFAVFRTVTSNPGFWFFHCHFTNHAHDGMAMVFEVGSPEKDMPKAPGDFPLCADFPSDAMKKRNGASTFSPMITIITLVSVQLLIVAILRFAYN